VRGAVAFGKTCRALTVPAEIVLGLLNARDDSDQSKADGIDRRLPGQRELLFCAKRSCMRGVADVEIRDEAEHTLLLFILDLFFRDFYRGESDLYLGQRSRNRQGDGRDNIKLARMQGAGKCLRLEA